MTGRLKIAVCDDDSSAVEIISGAVESALKKYDVIGVIDKFVNPKEFIKNASYHNYDLLLLDIDMPGIDGITAGKQLRKEKIETDIIFVSSREDKVFETFSVHPFGFIRKSNFLKDISSVINQYLESRPKKSNNILVVNNKDKTVTIMIDDIMYFESLLKNQLIFVRGEKEPFVMHRTMESLESEFAEKGFIRIHKGYLVNFRYIKSILSDCVVLTDNKRVALSVKRIKEIKNKYIEYSQNSGTVLF